MKYIIIGLGTFGSALAKKLTKSGNEVIGVDKNMAKVEAYKEQITHTICLDSTDPNVVSHLPIANTDVAIVCIGEDEGDNIMTTALLKKLHVKRLISRSVSPLHETVLESMGVDEIVHPEELTAIRLAKKLEVSGNLGSYEFSSDYNIFEVAIPNKFIGKTLLELNISNNYNVLVLTTLKIYEEKNEFGMLIKTAETQGLAASSTILKQGDLMVLYGTTDNIKKLLNT